MNTLIFIDTSPVKYYFKYFTENIQLFDIRYAYILERWQFSFYDSLIISAALQLNCKILYTEDLQHHQKIQDLNIYDPFILLFLVSLFITPLRRAVPR